MILSITYIKIFNNSLIKLMKKITGFTQKKHPYQLIGYIIFFGDLLVYILIITPLSNDICKVIYIFMEIFIWIYSIYLGNWLRKHSNICYINNILCIHSNWYRSYWWLRFRISNCSIKKVSYVQIKADIYC